MKEETIKAEAHLFSELELSNIIGVNPPTAIICIHPELDESVTKFQRELNKVLSYAELRVIKTDADLTPASDDLILIAGLRKSLTAKIDEYVKPIKGHLADAQAVFTPMLDVLKQAEVTNKAKVSAYTDAQKARVAEAERLNRESQELARKQAAFSATGEFTVDTTKLEAPAPVRKVSTGLGSISEVGAPSTWEEEDWDLIPRQYKMLDSPKISKVVRSGGQIPGIKVIKHTTIRTNLR